MDAVSCISKFVAFFFGIGVIIGTVLFVMSIFEGEDFSGDKSWRRFVCLYCMCIFVFILSLVAAVLTPTTKEMAAIYIIPKVANNEQLQGLGQDLVDLAKTWVAELMPKKESEAK